MLVFVGLPLLCLLAFASWILCVAFALVFAGAANLSMLGKERLAQKKILHTLKGLKGKSNE